MTLSNLTSERVLAVFAGLFFLIPGLFKVASPGDFQEFLSFFPTHFESISQMLFWLVTILQIVGGVALIAGKQFRMFTLPLAVVSIVALLTTVPNDTGSGLQYVAFLTHIMTFGIFMGLFMIGPKGTDWTEMIIAKDAERGWDLVRISLAWFWAGLGLAIWFAPQLLGRVPFELGFLGNGFAALLFLVVGFSLLLNFYTHHAAKGSLGLFAILLVLWAVPDMNESKIGLINLLFFVLGVGASLAIDMRSCPCWKRITQ